MERITILEDQVIDRLDYLIEKGISLLSDLAEGEDETARFWAWQTQCTVYLNNLVGQEHEYTKRFVYKNLPSIYDQIYIGIEVLQALQEDVADNCLFDIKNLVSAEVFADFLGMAEHLIETGYKDPAASLIGAVLEDGLRRIASNHDIKVKSRDDLGSLNQRCADKGVYTRLEQQRVQFWNTLRNDADHGHFGSYTEQDVKEMLPGVRNFLARFLV